MLLTFISILGFLLALVRPLQRNPFFVLHFGLVVGAAYLTERFGFKLAPFFYKTFLLFVVYHLISINAVTFLAYGVDKRAAQHGQWRIAEVQLHTLEFLGGWCGAYVAQKFFRHKTKKKSYQAMFWLMLAFEGVLIYYILNFLRIIH